MEIDRRTLEFLLQRARRAESETADEHYAVEDATQALRDHEAALATPSTNNAGSGFYQPHLFDPAPYEA